MRLLVFTLLMLMLATPALAFNDFDADPVMHGHHNKSKDDGKTKDNTAAPGSGSDTTGQSGADKSQARSDKEAAKEEARQARLKAKADKKAAKEAQQQQQLQQQQNNVVSSGGAPTDKQQAAAEREAAKEAARQQKEKAKADRLAEIEREKAGKNKTSADEGKDGAPLGTYFGNGDEYVQGGAPPDNTPITPPDQSVDSTDAAPGADSAPDTRDGTDSQPRSAILGPHHNAPAFDNDVTSDSAGTPSHNVDKSAEATNSDTDTTATTSDDNGSQAPSVQTGDIAPADSAATGQQSGDTVRVDPGAGLDHYNTYPQMQGKGKVKNKQKLAKQGSKQDDQSGNSSDSEQKPKRHHGLDTSNPDS